jgi:hypothetical protein
LLALLRRAFPVRPVAVGEQVSSDVRPGISNCVRGQAGFNAAVLVRLIATIRFLKPELFILGIVQKIETLDQMLGQSSALDSRKQQGCSFAFF